MTTRVFPPATGNQSAATFGRIHDGTASAYLDVPDQDALQLEANRWTLVAPVGTSSARPGTPKRGDQFLDLTLGYLVVFDGAVWRNPATAASA